MSAGRIDELLNPSPETMVTLDAALTALRNVPPNQVVPDHAFQTATVLLSHSPTHKHYIREGIAIMERVACAAHEELRLSGGLSASGAVINDNKQLHLVEQQGDPTATNRTVLMKEHARTNARQLLVSCYIFLAVGHYKLQNYSESRAVCERCLELEPHHPKAVALRDRIDESVLTNAAIGVAGVVAGVVAVGVLMKGLWRMGRK